MKTTTLILFATTLICSCKNTSTPAEAPVEATKPKADTVPKPQPVVQYDSVDVKDIWVQNKAIVGTTVKDFEPILKKADSVTKGKITEFFYDYTEYNIKGTVIRYHDSVFANFNMHDNALTFSIAGHSVKIGDDQIFLKAMFPKPFAERDTSIYKQLNETMVYVFVKKANIELHFLLNKQGIIIGIEIMTVLDVG